jgi:catechol 2,3-dioxygenase-like lactoylglutathione lyase family enzyme
MSSLTWLGVPGDVEAWRALGFDAAARFAVGTAVLEPSTDPAWGFDEVSGDPGRLGVSTFTFDTGMTPATHPNRIDGIDHVVYAVPDLDAAIASIEDVLGLRLRRRAQPRGPDGPEMAFFRCGEGFIEVVSAGAGPALYGIAFRCPDLDVTVAAMREAGAPVGDPKPAVQGGRIASVWREHVGYPVAVMEPPSRGA